MISPVSSSLPPHLSLSLALSHAVGCYPEKLPEVLKCFKLVNNHYGCAAEWVKRIINSPEALVMILLGHFHFVHQGLIRDG